MLGIKDALLQIFDRHRIVFWYDAEEELCDEYESLQLADVEKVTVKVGQFFGLKYKVLREAPKQRFLLYCPFEVPPPHQNGLLDLQESHGTFRADKASLYLQELGLNVHLHRLVKDHLLFFESKERRQKLKELVHYDITDRQLKMEMLSVVFNTYSTSLEDFIPAYTHEIIESEKFNYTHQLDRYRLTQFFWDEISKAYGYSGATNSFYDLILFLFSNGHRISSSSAARRDILVLLSGWQDSSQHQAVFRTISFKVAKDLNIRDQLVNSTFEHILKEDLFPVIDEYLIEEWSAELSQADPNLDDILQGLKVRQNSFWYSTYRSVYLVLESAVRFLRQIEKQDYTIHDFEHGMRKYTEVIYPVDQHYRKFIFYWQEARQNQLFQALYDKVCRIYSNIFLQQLSRSWQNIINITTESSREFKHHPTFFEKEVRKFIDKDQRIFVIVSDAFRYEIGREFLDKITNENRFQAELSYRICPVPSYTQLGMAALLPHEHLTIQDGSDAVLVDGVSTQGLEARKKIISNSANGTAINAEDFVRFTTDEGREFVKNQKVVYIFHNLIDKTGDDKITESQVSAAVEEEMEFLINVIKSIASYNGTNMILTSDHGFIYDHNYLHESEFLTTSPAGKIWKKNRRFVIGQELKVDGGFVVLDGPTLGLQEGIQVAFPKELKRLRISGAGSQFVHGGLSLQEIIVPVIRIKKLRTNTVVQTHVDIIHHSKDITNNITPVHFIQSDAVEPGVLPRTIKAYFRGSDGEVLTDIFERTFESSETENRNREVIHRFHFLSRASTQYRNETIQLVLEEPIEGSSRYRVYKTFDFRMRTTIERDF